MNLTPIERWRIDLPHVRQLGVLASQIDEMFYHRVQRQVRKDGCVSINGKWFEVPYALTEQKVQVVFDPETDVAKWVESEHGQRLGDAMILDKVHNTHRKRQRPTTEHVGVQSVPSTSNPIELAYAQQQSSLIINQSKEI